MEVVASLSQGRTAAAQCGLFTHKSVPVIFETPCISVPRVAMFRLRNTIFTLHNIMFRSENLMFRPPNVMFLSHNTKFRLQTVMLGPQNTAFRIIISYINISNCIHFFLFSPPFSVLCLFFYS